MSLAGIPDLAEGSRQDICSGAVRELMGGLPEDISRRYRCASPSALLPLGVPERHLVGECDRVVPPSYLRDYVRYAGQYGDVTLDILPDSGHFELVTPGTPAWEVVVASVRALVAG